MSTEKQQLLADKNLAMQDQTINTENEKGNHPPNVGFADNLPQWELLPPTATIKRIKRNI